MTLSTSPARSGPYLGDGTATTFDFTFPVLDAGHLAVWLTAADGTETRLSHPAGFTAQNVGNAAGGTVTLSTAPASGATVTILRDMPLEQQTDYVNQSAFLPETIETALDRLTMVQQAQAEQMRRAVTVAVGSTDNPADYMAAITSSRDAAASHAGSANGHRIAAETAADIANTAASTATAKADQADVAASVASTARTVAETALDQFIDLYLGAKAADPTADNDGDALQNGALYLNTAAKELRAYNSANSTWYSVASAAAAAASAATAASEADAAASATNAAASATAAANSANTANTSANFASNHATAAAGSADDAEQSAQSANTSSLNAQASAAAAADSASNAAGAVISTNAAINDAHAHAIAAAGSASDAASSAGVAGTSANNAGNSATTADTKAIEAVQAAATATTKAAEAAASAASTDPLGGLARARFNRDYPAVQAPSKIIDLRVGHGVEEITFTRPTIAHHTDARRVLVSVAANAPRLEHSAAGAPEGLAVAPARTRLNLYPVELEHAAWSKSNVTVTANDGPSPDGVTAARKIEDTSGAALGSITRDTSVGATAHPYLVSAYVLKRAGAPICQLILTPQFGGTNGAYGTAPASVYLDPETGAVTGTGTVDLDHGVVDHGRWWRIWVRSDNDLLQTHCRVMIRPAVRAPGDLNGPDDVAVTGYNHFWGVMLERTDVLAPPIPGTEASQVTIDGDNAKIDLSAATWFDDTAGEGTFLIDISMDWCQQNSGPFNLRTTTNAYITWRNTYVGDFVGTLPGTKRGKNAGYRFSSGLITAPGGDIAGAIKVMGEHRVVLAWDQAGLTVGMDGLPPNRSDWSGGLPIFNELHLGGWIHPGRSTIARFGRVAYWPRKLSNTEIQTVTGAPA